LCRWLEWLSEQLLASAEHWLINICVLWVGEIDIRKKQAGCDQQMAEEAAESEQWPTSIVSRAPGTPVGGAQSPFVVHFLLRCWHVMLLYAPDDLYMSTQQG
jgi:hypothetical protein